MKRFTIYNSDDNFEDYYKLVESNDKNAFAETFGIYEDDVRYKELQDLPTLKEFSEYRDNYNWLMDSIAFFDQMDRENAMLELKRIADKHDWSKFIVLADVGTWQGSRYGYKVIDDISEIFYGSVDRIEIYIDGNGILRQDGFHHDGSNYGQVYAINTHSITEDEYQQCLDGDSTPELFDRAFTSIGNTIKDELFN